MSATLSDPPASGVRLNLATANWPGVSLCHATQDIARSITWRIRDEARDTVVVHLAGPISRLESELDGCGSLCDPPMPGEVWVIPAGQSYASYAEGRIVQYAELFFDSQFPLLADRSSPPPAPRAGHGDDFLYRSVLRLLDWTSRSDDLSRLAAESLSLSLRFHFWSAYRHRDTPPVPRPRRLVGIRFTAVEERLILQYLDTNLAASISLTDLCRLVHMKNHDLLIAFRRSFGSTPAQFLIDRRLRRARWLLTHTAKGIAAIAHETGFSSHSHLTTALKQRSGVTPSEFRSSRRLNLIHAHP